MPTQKNFDPEELAKVDVPMLRRHTEVLSQLASDIFVQGIRHEENDHFASMCLCFVSRQAEHIKTILLLISHKDAGLIARSMFEGLIQLLWACQDKTARGQQWTSYACIEDWRTWRKNLKNGWPRVPDEEQLIRNNLELYGQRFLKNQQKIDIKEWTKRAFSKSTLDDSDPFHTSWKCGTKLSQMSRDVEGDILYKNAYSVLSDWAHWGPLTFGHQLQLRENGVNFSTTSYVTAAQSLSLVFQCLSQSLGILNDHLNLGKREAIDDLRRDYISDLENVLSEPSEAAIRA